MQSGVYKVTVMAVALLLLVLLFILSPLRITGDGTEPAFGVVLGQGEENNISDTFTGTAQRDILFGNGGGDTLQGLDGKDIVRGSRGADHITGGNQGDDIGGGGGPDDIRGGADDDWISVADIEPDSETDTRSLLPASTVDCGAGNGDVVEIDGPNQMVYERQIGPSTTNRLVPLPAQYQDTVVNCENVIDADNAVGEVHDLGAN